MGGRGHPPWHGLEREKVPALSKTRNNDFAPKLFPATANRRAQAYSHFRISLALHAFRHPDVMGARLKETNILDSWCTVCDAMMTAKARRAALDLLRKEVSPLRERQTRRKTRPYRTNAAQSAQHSDQA